MATITPSAPLTPSLPNGDLTTPLSRPKLHGRAFYESLGSPKMILAPMVDQSEYVCPPPRFPAPPTFS